MQGLGFVHEIASGGKLGVNERERKCERIFTQLKLVAFCWAFGRFLVNEPTGVLAKKDDFCVLFVHGFVHEIQVMAEISLRILKTEWTELTESICYFLF